MKPNLQIMTGDALETLRRLPDNSVHCCITSPPYWQLRDYGCPGQLGLEASPAEYLARMAEVFGQVSRVLRHDGTLWLNMGDGHCSNAPHTPGVSTMNRWENPSAPMLPRPQTPEGLKPKDLIGMPWRLALTLQAAGWYLRSDIIWHKPNPMPETIRDRPTRAHEYLFLLSKSGSYYYDAWAVREPVTGRAHARGHGVNPKARIPTGWDTGPGNHRTKVGRYKKPGPGSRIHIDRDPAHASRAVKQNRSFSAAISGLVKHRARRSVWTIPTSAYKGSHYATFPPRLVEPCILAGTSAGGCCPSCGTPQARQTDQETDADGVADTISLGFTPGCDCYASPDLFHRTPPAPIPCTVLDPFAGSGTVGQAARQLGRASILIDIDPRNRALIEERCGVKTLTETTP